MVLCLVLSDNCVLPRVFVDYHLRALVCPYLSCVDMILCILQLQGYIQLSAFLYTPESGSAGVDKTASSSVPVQKDSGADEVTYV